MLYRLEHVPVGALKKAIKNRGGVGLPGDQAEVF
jgi:hypothetical protein